ncbi:hypothetical protein ACVGVM_10830 [Pseudonocardia bannensis]|uniref:Nitroreductase n=1 Tax=Pseudonocardia bannensis TaxID=630973 RepID=A0A848DRP3_9PSEU|nr:hypothetical protein [Pseudonocardia bannensis]NMH95408.1 hypothetical protein [Pseudonocardia bannensis]
MTVGRAAPHDRLDPLVADGLGPAEILAAAVPSRRIGLPWRLRWIDRGFELRANRKALPEDDPGVRELRIVSGAALLDMRLAVSVQGRRPVTSLVPDPAQPGLLAVLRIGERAHPTPEELALHETVPQRPAPGQPRHRRPVPVALLRRAAEIEGVWLRRVPAVGDRLLPRHAAVHPADADPGPVAVTIGGFDDRPVTQLQAGQAMRRVELTAAALGLTAAGLAVPVEDPEVRRTLTGLVGPGLYPQVVLRVGAGDPVDTRPVPVGSAV